MLAHRVGLFAFLWASIRTAAIGQPADSWDAVGDLVRQAAPKATAEYCGALAYRSIDYYLFVLEQNELSGVVLIRQQAGSEPIIIDADTSFFPFKKDQEPALDEPVIDGVEILLRRRNLAKRIGIPRDTSTRSIASPTRLTSGNRVDVSRGMPILFARFRLRSSISTPSMTGSSSAGS